MQFVAPLPTQTELIFARSLPECERRRGVALLNELSQRTYASPFWMAALWAGMGDKDEAFRWFGRVFAERASAGAVSLKVNPIFDPLRCSDPRYADLLRRAHLVSENQ